MHLLGQGMKFVLDPGTPNQKTLLDITNYNFDYQRSYNIATPITTKRRGHDPGHLHLQPDAAPAAPAVAQAPAPLRHVG